MGDIFDVTKEEHEEKRQWSTFQLDYNQDTVYVSNIAIICNHILIMNSLSVLNY